LTENHAQHLIPTSKMPDIFVAVIFLDNAVENALRKKFGQLCENIFACVHVKDFSHEHNFKSSRNKILLYATDYNIFKELFFILVDTCEIST